MEIENRRTLEIFMLGGILAIGAPCAVLMGDLHGERAAVVAWPKAEVRENFVVDYKSMVMGSVGDAERGKELFQANCMACHGAMGDGKGPAASALTPAPRDFLDPKVRWTRGREPMEIYLTLSEGSPGTAMVGFSVSLTERDRWALVHYLGTLPGVQGQFKPVDEALAAAWRPEGKR